VQKLLKSPKSAKTRQL